MKYLVSLYFDENTNKRIFKHMQAVAEVTGNQYMIVNRVPPHITVSSLEIDETTGNDVIKRLEDKISELLEGLPSGEVQWIGCGAFMNSVLYLSLVLNTYLQDIMQRVYDAVSECPAAEISRFYQPFQWLPHTTIGKKMTAEELVKGFETVQVNFRVLQGKVVKVGLAKVSPYDEIAVWNLK